MTDATDESKIPTATWDALREVVIAAKGSNQIAGIKSESEWIACAHAIAAPLIAAELRARTVDLIETALVLRGEAGFAETNEVKAYRLIAETFRQRADELDPPA